MNIKLNFKEIALGASFGLALSFLVGLRLGLFAAIGCAILWSVGGSGKGRAFRFLGVPAVALVAIGVFDRSNIAAALAGLVLAQGYGIPSPDPKPKGDKGSPLGRFFYNLAGTHERRATLYTRGTLAALLAIAYLPVHGLSTAWIQFAGALVVLHLAAVKFVEGSFEF